MDDITHLHLTDFPQKNMIPLLTHTNTHTHTHTHTHNNHPGRQPVFCHYSASSISVLIHICRWTYAKSAKGRDTAQHAKAHQGK